MGTQATPVDYQLDGKVAHLALDDGKANAISPDLIALTDQALSRAEREARAVLISGRPGRFSAGFDLSIMTAGPDQARTLVTRGAELLMRIYLHPQPVVVACTGHALAAGALLLLAADTRIGVRGDFKIGLNEVAIGLRLPIFAIELARDRLSKRHFVAATIQARLYGPDEACDAGFLDRVVDAGTVIPQAMEAARLLADLPGVALAQTKALVRERVAGRIRETLAADMAQLAPPSNVTAR